MTRRHIARALESVGARDTGNNEFTKDNKVVIILFNRTLVMTLREEEDRMMLLMMVPFREVLGVVEDKGHIVVLTRCQR